ncbi:DUF3536 domain-containing protein [Chitinispirillales bacterium ANBcel5]|uniref:DUF3536 domain-containing protein n=1 Tax=Cellulosispirillum alkaliphilum TaxID=3039283 RepID=UPI002A521127|nr:DUF3536 domain-containing protein [Chitinispirillales bacterium ANBcel5]
MTGNNSKKYLVVHGHFYQPPRENPWLDIIEKQDSAAPFNDWNERIYDQCYRPNAYSRLLDGNGMIADIHNNYQNMSFNFGPTLFSWLERYHSRTVQRILDADKHSRIKFNGHGNAIAQVYNHIIMPLASKRDQLTQIRWAKYVYRRRFGSDPEGMWLGETAINMETVLCLVEENIKFVVLSPNQAEKYRRIGEGGWTFTSQQGIDTRIPYRIFPRDRNGVQHEKYLDVFFFDEGLSKEISFNDLLTDSRIFGNRINSCYDHHNDANQIVTIATDGETFGHHKPFGDMCLAYFFKAIAPELGITPVNFGYYLSVNPPTHEVTLKNDSGEGTAWSCAHGVGRWTRDCGCKTGGEDSWHQAWRKPLRESFEYLQHEIDQQYESRMSDITNKPWDLRDKYISVMGKASVSKMRTFLKNNCTIGDELDDQRVLEIRTLLEAQKFMLFAFTSCGWFFSDISGIETIQNMAYACRALQLGICKDKQKETLERFLEHLEKAPSNVNNANGRTLFERHILPFFHHERILAFTAAIQQILAVKKSSTYSNFAYTLKARSLKTLKGARAVYDVALIDLENPTTGEKSAWSVLVSHQHETELRGWVTPAEKKLSGSLASKPDAWMTHEDALSFSLSDLFYSSRRELNKFLQKNMSSDTDKRFNDWFKQNEKHINLLSKLGIDLPEYAAAPLEYVYQQKWNKLILGLQKRGSEDEVFGELLQIYTMMNRYSLALDFEETAGELQEIIIKELIDLSEKLTVQKCERLKYLLNIVDRFSIPVIKNKLEDLFFPILRDAVSNFCNDCNIQNASEKHGSISNGTLELVVKFARRMNFSTTSYSS